MFVFFMRWMIFLFVGVFLVGLVGAIIPDDCDWSMAAYWKMDGDATEGIADADGSGWPGDGGVLKVGTSASFDGSEKITVSSVDILSAGFTIEMWIQKNGAPMADGILFKKGDYVIEYLANNTVRGSVGDVSVDSGVLGVGVPRYVALVWEPISEDLILYMDGTCSVFGIIISGDAWGKSCGDADYDARVDVASAGSVEGADCNIDVEDLMMYGDNSNDESWCGDKLYSDPSSPSNVDSATLFSVGVYAGALEMGEGFVGLMDEVGVYDRAFDSDDIGAHYVLSDSGRDYCDASGIGSSTTKTDFNIAGCSLPGGGGLTIDSCSRAEIAGEYYCDSDKNLLPTREFNYGCSRGLDPDSWALGDPYCCPSGMFCNETAVAFKCDYRTEQCWNQTNEADCRAIGCVWLEEENVCADGTRDYGCSLYDSSSECGADVWNLGKTGIGTEFCGTSMDCEGTSYTIPYESCECRWNGVTCDLYMNGSETYYDNEATREWFSCSKDYVIGECVEGEQDVAWTAASTVNNGFDPACLDVMGCADGSSVRLCGEPIIRLPGFSLFALFVSVVVIGGYYACFASRRFARE